MAVKKIKELIFGLNIHQYFGILCRGRDNNDLDKKLKKFKTVTTCYWENGTSLNKKRKCHGIAWRV